MVESPIFRFTIFITSQRRLLPHVVANIKYEPFLPSKPIQWTKNNVGGGSDRGDFWA